MAKPRQRVAARVAADPELLAKRPSSIARSPATLRGAFDPVMEAGCRRRASHRREVVDFARGAGAQARRGRFGVPQWAAMAATLAIGLSPDSLVGDRSEAPSRAATACWSRRLRSIEALDTQLASAEPADGASARRPDLPRPRRRHLPQLHRRRRQRACLPRRRATGDSRLFAAPRGSRAIIAWRRARIRASPR